MGIKSAEGRVQSLAAGLVLQYALNRELGTGEGYASPEFSFAFGKSGKPYLTGNPEVFFNLSHSGDYVLCGVSRREIGVDLQRKKAVNPGLARRFFPDSDQEYLESSGSSAEREERFARIWTVRESYVKLTGRGMGQGIGSFAIDWEKGLIVGEGGAGGDQREDGETAGFICWEPVKGYEAAACRYSRDGEMAAPEIVMLKLE